MSESPRAVFLSYASQDTEAAQRICEALRAAGVEVWFDQNELVGGDAWDQKIRKQIKDCALLIPIISAATEARTEGYFRLEWRLADQRTHLMAKGRPFLLPVVIDATRDAEAHVPDSFTEVQWTRLGPASSRGQAGSEGEDPVLAKLVARVKKLLGGESEAARVSRPVGSEYAVEETRAPQKPKRARWLLPAIICSAALIAFAMWQPWRSADKTTPPPVLSAVAAAASSTSASAAPLTEAQKLVQQAQKIYENGDELDRETLILADELVKRALTLDSSEPTAWLLGAQLSYVMVWQSFDSSEARKAELERQAARARALAPESVPAQLVVANARLAVAYSNFQSASNRQDLAGVEQDLLALAAQAPGDYKVQRALGQTYRFLKRPDEALRALQRAQELSGGDPAAAGDIINVLLRRKRYAEAEAMVAPALARRPIGRMLVLDVMLKLQWRDDLPGAQAALAAWPGWLMREDRGAFIAWQTWLWSGRPDMALDVAQRLPRDYLRDVWFTGPRAVLTARAHELAGNRESALADWRTVVRLTDQELAGSEDEIAALFWKAWALSRLGDRAGAEAAATLLQQRMTSQTVFFNCTNLALLWSTMGRTDLATAQLRASFGADNDAYAVTRAMLELDPAYAPLRADPHFAELAAAAISPVFPKSQTPTPGASEQRPVDQKSVAVLAFANLSDDKANEYFSDGISEELLNVLAKIPGLKVSARTSAFSFKGKEVPVPEIARQLGVAYVIEGSVRKQGEKVRITAQLIKAADGFHVWSDTFTRDLKDIFAVQDEIAGLIAQQLQLKLGETGVKAAVDPAIYELLLQARELTLRDSNTDTKNAIALYRLAVEREPRLALAWAEMARSYIQLGRFGGLPTADAMREARDAAQKALELDPDQPIGLVALGWVQRTADWDWRGARHSFQRALELAPGNPAVMGDAAVFYFNIGQLAEGQALARAAVVLDPLNARAQATLGFILTVAGEWAQGMAPLEKAATLAPAIEEVRSHLARDLAGLDRTTEAEAMARQEPNEAYRWVALTIVYAQRGDDAASRKVLTDFIAKYGEEMPGYVANLYGIRGEVDLAFDWLDRSLARRDAALPWSKTNYNCRSLHQDPRWAVFLRKIGLSDEQLK